MFSVQRFVGIPASAMFKKSLFPIYLLLFLLFIGFGDKFLPQPLSGASYKTRTALNNFMTSNVKFWTPKTDPYARTEKALNDAEKGNNPKN